MKSPKTGAAVMAVAALLALAFGLWYNAPSVRQARADAHLRNAILHNNTRGVVNALAEGANPNATFLFTPPYDRNLTLWQRAKNAWHHVPPEPPVAMSPLALAIFGGASHDLPLENPVIVEELLRHGANPNCSVYDAPLIVETAFFNKAATINLLLQYGANINVKDNDGETALTVAAQGEQYAVVETLLAHGASINAPGLFGWTPLMEAVNGDGAVNTEARRLPIVRLLLRHHADVLARDQRGRTALSIAQIRLANWPREDPATLRSIIVLLQAAQAKAKAAP